MEVILRKPLGNLRSYWIWLLVFYISTRLLYLFSSGMGLDFMNQLQNPEIFIQNKANFLQSYLLLEEKYPPLIFFIMGGFFSIFGYTSFSFHLLYVLFEAGSILVIWKIASYYFQNKESVLKIIFLYSCFPTVSFYMISTFLLVPIATFFFLIALYFYLKKQFFFCGLFGCCGFLIEIHPIIFLFLIAIILLARREWKSLANLLLGFIIAFLGISLPFFNFNFSLIFSYIFTNFSGTASFSIMDFVGPVNISLFNSFTFNLLNLPIIIFIPLFAIWEYHFVRKNPSLPVQKELQIVLMFYLIIPFLLWSILQHYFFWCLPILFLGIDFDLRRIGIKKFIPIQIGTIALFCVLSNIILPNGLFSNVADYYTLQLKETGGLSFFLMAYIFLLAFTGIWALFWIKSINKTMERLNPSYSLLLYVILFLLAMNAFAIYVIYYEYYSYAINSPYYNPIYGLIATLITVLLGLTILAMTISKFYKENIKMLEE